VNQNEIVSELILFSGTHILMCTTERSILMGPDISVY